MADALAVKQMGCYRLWTKEGRAEDVHGVRIGIETTGHGVVIEPENHPGATEADRLHGFLLDVTGGARLPVHDNCPGETDFLAIVEKLCGPR